jgi:hypothetical protein
MTGNETDRLRSLLDQLTATVEAVDERAHAMLQLLEQFEDLVSATLKSSDPQTLHRLFGRGLILVEEFRKLEGNRNDQHEDGRRSTNEMSKKGTTPERCAKCSRPLSQDELEIGTGCCHRCGHGHYGARTEDHRQTIARFRKLCGRLCVAAGFATVTAAEEFYAAQDRQE